MAVASTLKTIREAIADQLGLLIQTTIDVDANPVFTISGLSDKSPDAERMRDAALYQSGESRRIVSYGYPASDQVTVTRTSAITTGACQIYMMLAPDELNGAINEALQELFALEGTTVTLIAATYTYALPSWIQQRGQITSVKWRDTSIVSTNPAESEIGSYRIIESANTCTLIVNDLLQDVTKYDVQVYARRNYSSLTSDAGTTTCPYPLIISVGMVKVLHKLFNKYGKGIASLYGPKMQVAEKQMMTAKTDWLPKLVAREYVEEERWEGVDGNANFDYPNW
jgi:hypothetical protein